MYLVYKPMASPLGIGLNIKEAKGNMVVDIDGNTTQIAVMSLGGMVVKESVRMYGNELTSDIHEYMRIQHNVLVGDNEAEQIKIQEGSVLEELSAEIATYNIDVVGRNTISCLPVEVKI